MYASKIFKIVFQPQSLLKNCTLAYFFFRYNGFIIQNWDDYQISNKNKYLLNISNLETHLGSEKVLFIKIQIYYSLVMTI